MPIRLMTRTSRLRGALATDMRSSLRRKIADLSTCPFAELRAGAMRGPSDVARGRTLVSPALLGRSAMKRWKYRPEGSTWGDWGEDDQLGRLNLITAKKVLE